MIWNTNCSVPKFTEKVPCSLLTDWTINSDKSITSAFWPKNFPVQYVYCSILCRGRKLSRMRRMRRPKWLLIVTLLSVCVGIRHSVVITCVLLWLQSSLQGDITMAAMLGTSLLVAFLSITMIAMVTGDHAPDRSEHATVVVGQKCLSGTHHPNVSFDAAQAVNYTGVCSHYRPNSCCTTRTARYSAEQKYTIHHLN